MIVSKLSELLNSWIMFSFVDTNAKSEPASVRANFNHTKDVDKPTEMYFYESEAAKDVYEAGDDPHEMDVIDDWVRDGIIPFSVDKEGFALHPFQSEYKSWLDEEHVRETFYPEVVRFLKKTTGAKRILVYVHRK